MNVLFAVCGSGDLQIPWGFYAFLNVHETHVYNQFCFDKIPPYVCSCVTDLNWQSTMSAQDQSQPQPGHIDKEHKEPMVSPERSVLNADLLKNPETTAHSGADNHRNSDNDDRDHQTYPDGRPELLGVGFDDDTTSRRPDRWIARITLASGEYVEIARCTTAVAAAFCYDYAAREQYGPQAQTNFGKGFTLSYASRWYGTPKRQLHLPGYLNEDDIEKVLEEGEDTLSDKVELPGNSLQTVYHRRNTSAKDVNMHTQRQTWSTQSHHAASSASNVGTHQRQRKTSEHRASAQRQRKFSTEQDNTPAASRMYFGEKGKDTQGTAMNDGENNQGKPLQRKARASQRDKAETFVSSGTSSADEEDTSGSDSSYTSTDYSDKNNAQHKTKSRSASTSEPGQTTERPRKSRKVHNEGETEQQMCTIYVKGPDEIGTGGADTKEKHSTSVFRGVIFIPPERKPWHAQVYIHDCLKHIGSYSCEEAAANAYDNWLRRMASSVAVNFPRQGEQYAVAPATVIKGLELKRQAQMKLIDKCSGYIAKGEPGVVATEFVYKCCLEVKSKDWYIKLPRSLVGRNFDELLDKLELQTAETARGNQQWSLILPAAPSSLQEIPVLLPRRTSEHQNTNRKNEASAGKSSASSVKTTVQKPARNTKTGNVKRKTTETPSVVTKFNRAYTSRMQVTSKDVSEIGSDILPLSYKYSESAHRYSEFKRKRKSVCELSLAESARGTQGDTSLTRASDEHPPLHRNFFPHATQDPNDAEAPARSIAFVYSPFHNHLHSADPSQRSGEVRMPIGFGPYDPITENGFGASPTYRKTPPRAWRALPSYNQVFQGSKAKENSDFVGTKQRVIKGTREKGWYASIERGGITRWLGPYTTEEQAAQAFDVASLLTHGLHARTNFCYDMKTFFRRELDSASKEIVPLDNSIDQYYSQLKDHKMSRVKACQLQLASDIFPSIGGKNAKPANAGKPTSSNGIGVSIIPSTDDICECSFEQVAERLRQLYRTLSFLIITQRPYYGVFLRKNTTNDIWGVEHNEKRYKSAKMAALAVDVNRSTKSENVDLNFSSEARRALIESSSEMRVDHPGLDLIDERVVGSEVANYALQLLDKLKEGGRGDLWKELAETDTNYSTKEDRFPESAPRAEEAKWESDDGNYDDGAIKRV